MNPYLDLRGRERRKTKEGEREGKRGDGDPLQFKIVPRAHEHAAGYALSLSLLSYCYTTDLQVTTISFADLICLDISLQGSMADTMHCSLVLRHD